MSLYSDLTEVLTPYANKINELNGSLETLTGKDVTGTFVAKKYLVTNPDAVTQVDIASPVTNNSWSYKKISVTPGDEYTLTVYGGITPRAWCVTDAEYNIIITSNPVPVESELVTIPSNGAYLILNHRTDKNVTASVIKGRTVESVAKKADSNFRLSEDFKKSFSDLLDVLAFESSGTVKDKVTVLKNSLSGAIYNSSMYVPVNYNLANVSSNNDALEVALGSAFTTTLSADADCTIYDLSVKMGGIDITATAYNTETHVISIASVTGVIEITALAESDYEKNTESIYGTVETLAATVSTFAKKAGTGDNTMVVPGVYYEKGGAYNCTVVSKVPFGSCIVNETGNAPTDYYLIKIPTDAVGVRVESTPTETQLQVRVHPLTENELIDNYTMGDINTNWKGSTVSYNLNEATLTALAGYGAGLWVHTKHDGTASSANRYDLHPELIPKVKITFLKQE